MLQQFIIHFRDIAQIAPEIQLIIWSCAILLVMAFLKDKYRYRDVPYYFALIGLIVTTVTYFQQALSFVNGTHPEGLHYVFNKMYSVDGLSLFFKAIFLGAGLLTVLMSRRFLEEEHAPRTEFLALLLICIASMMFMASSMDLITIYISLEMTSISIYILVGYLKYQKRATEASLKYFILGAFSSALLLFGMSLAFGMTGSTNLEKIYNVVTNPSSHISFPFLILSMILILAGIGFKIAAVPFHMWCPDAYEGAPTPFTAFISVAPKAAGFAIFMRLFLYLFKSATFEYVSFIGLLSILTMTVGNVLAVKQTNIKRLLAYSSISHAGYLLMGMMDREFFGLQAIGVYVVAYLFMNLGAFAIIVFMRRNNNMGEELDEYSGLIYTNPLIAACMTVFLLSLAGIPPTIGFVGKYWVFSSVIKKYIATGDRLFLYVAIIGVINAVVALFYYFRIVKRMFMGEKRKLDPLAMGFDSRLTLFLTMLGTLALGIYPEPVIRFASWIGMTFIGIF